jgi:hypothetical protein
MLDARRPSRAFEEAVETPVDARVVPGSDLPFPQEEETT